MRRGNRFAAAKPPVNRANRDIVLQLESVHRSFRLGKREIAALAGISAEVTRGTITGLIGPDGAGKTTLIRLIAGLLRADSGQIEVLGFDVARTPLAVQARIGYMPQRFGLYEDLTVQENLELYADLQGILPAARTERYIELSRMTGLAPFRSRKAGALSGGMKQKLGLACTLLKPPDLLLLDEPTVGVDPVSRRELWQLIDHLARKRGTTVLFSTAYLDEAERCDTILLLHEGQLLGSGTPLSFASEVAGHCYFATTAAISARQLQALLLETAGTVIDAVVHAGRVRLVTRDASPPNLESLSVGIADLTLEAATPRVEDAFVARLRGQQQHLLPGTTSDGRPTSVAFDGLPLSTAASKQSVIMVQHVTRRFGRFTAVDDITFSVRRGEIFGLLGANGAGKSTTFRMLCGLLPPTEGVLSVAGFDIRRTAARARARIGYMAQKFSLYGDLSVRQNLRFFSSAYRLAGRQQKARLDWVIADFDLGHVLEVTARNLPLGFKQRLALVCALMHEPEILFLDEPTSGADPLARRDFWRRINELSEKGVTVLVTTHFMEEAEYCDRLLIMARGRVLTEGTPDSIRESARQPDLQNPTIEDAFISVIESATVPEPA